MVDYKQKEKSGNRVKMFLDLSFFDSKLSDEKGYLKEDIITTIAENIAKVFADVENRGFNKLSNSQLRAFFNEVKAINNRLNDKEENWDSVYPSILLIKSKIEYRASKDSKMENLKKFLLEAIKYIQGENKKGKGYKAFKDFVVFFEAIVGYSYGLGIK